MSFIVSKWVNCFSASFLKKCVFRLTSTVKSNKMQVFTQKRNPITGGTEWDVQHEDYDYHQEIARSAFADMLHDSERNKKYYRALQLAINKKHSEGKKANVLDIGTGTGLLSIMAVKCGADSVTACEAFKPMADCCVKILQQNGVADKIKIIPKNSTALIVGEDGDMKERANILVTEVFDTELIGEGALTTFDHAHKHLLEEDSIVVPDSAVIYAQVVECPTLQKWNKLNDLADEDLNIILKTPQNIKNCPGTAAVHDIQLSQLPRNSFTEISEQIPVFYYDWSGRTPIDMKRTVRQQFSVAATGKAQIVFMWWELNMDTEGRIVLSCAPWWSHPDTDLCSERPQDSIPWRDHWMQAVYYLPEELSVQKGTEVTLISCQDEYSVWFYLEDDNMKFKNYTRPICNCGVHMTFSRTHVSYLNDGTRSKKMLEQLKNVLVPDAVVLDLNGGSFMGLASAKLGAKCVYILESMPLNIGILEDYMKKNGLDNVKIISDVEEDLLKEVTNVVCDPNFVSSILPWENLKVAYLLHRFRNNLPESINIMPDRCEFWAMPVQFDHLHKIRVPLNVCEGIDMSIFDKLVENSRIISDADIESQPLWEYPCKCRGEPRKILDIHLKNLKPTFAADGVNSIVDTMKECENVVNGFALWCTWVVGGKTMCAGPTVWPTVGQIVAWDMHSRQAVQILKKDKIVKNTDKWCFQVACDLEKGVFNVALDFVAE